MPTVKQKPVAKRTVKSPARKKAVSVIKKSKAIKKDLSASYNKFKVFEGKQYSGMTIGRSHNWYYDRGEWKETKITPDLWEISYSVTKRRKGRAPEGSGVPKGTGYHWYILAYQNVTKLNANDYTTAMTGLKYKLAHKRADKNTWNNSIKNQRKRLAAFFKQMAAQLEDDVVPLEFEYKGTAYKGEAVPMTESCHDGVCDMLDVTLNDTHYGLIHYTGNNWKMKYVKDQKLVDTLGAEIMMWYE